LKVDRVVREQWRAKGFARVKCLWIVDDVQRRPDRAKLLLTCFDDEGLVKEDHRLLLITWSSRLLGLAALPEVRTELSRKVVELSLKAIGQDVRAAVIDNLAARRTLGLREIIFVALSQPSLLEKPAQL